MLGRTRRSFFLGRRLQRERETVAAMISLYCRDRHAAAPAPCAECADLEAYTRLRLEKCPYGEEKPTCADCPIHCYLPKRRQQIKEVMTYAGPRMLLSHPVLAVRHMVDGWRGAPPRKWTSPKGAGGKEPRVPGP